MNQSATAKRDREPRERFTILVAYEDMFTHNRVREVCDRLLDQFWGQLEFDFNWWSFKSLQDAGSSATAAQVALEAGLIILSAHAGQALPLHIQRWIDSWVGMRCNRDGALAALIGLPREKGAVPIMTYLQEVAQRAQLDFLPGTAAKAAPQRILGKPGARNPKRMVAEDLRRIMDPRRPPPHWGINE